MRSSAIYYALFLSIVMGSILGSMVLLSGLNRQLTNYVELPVQLYENAESGLNYGMVYHRELPWNEELRLNLFDGVMDSVGIIKRRWGLFTALESIARHKGHSESLNAFVGKEMEGSVNLFVVDNGRQLALCGDSRLEGNCFVPKAGLKRAYIAGENYSGSQLIYGQKHASERQLPPISEESIKSIQPPVSTLESWEDQGDSIQAEFKNPLQVLAETTVSLTHQVVDGAVWIEAKDSVFIGVGCQLKSTVIRADVIYVESGFQGTAQLIGRKRIVLEEGVKLLYPSVLAVIEDQPHELAAQIILKPKAQVIGTVFMLSADKDYRRMPELILEEESEIDGLAYNQGKTQLRGTVNGSLYTSKFFLKTPASSYENHILGGKVLNQLPEDFVCADLFDQGESAPLTQIQLLR